MASKKLSVIMPMYNETNMAENLKEVSSALNKFVKDYEIIVVDDGSRNNCFDEAKKFKSKKVRVVGYPKNKGKGNAIKYGFKFVRGDYVTFLDCGGDLDTGQIKKFIEIMEDKHADIVIGTKRHPQSKVHYPLFRRFMSAAYQLINKILFNLDVRDTQVGIKLFRREALNRIMPKIVIKSFAFDLELLVIAKKYNYKIEEAPINLNHKFRSTVSVKTIFWMLWDTAAIFYRLRILKHYG